MIDFADLSLEHSMVMLVPAGTTTLLGFFVSFERASVQYTTLTLIITDGMHHSHLHNEKITSIF